MLFQCEITEQEIRAILSARLAEKGIDIDPAKIKIMVKSKQNYRSEWEEADFKAVVSSQI